MVATYDRRGHGETPPSAEPFSHADDLITVIESLGKGPAFILGNSMGGGVGIDVGLMRPDLVSGLFLIAPAVSGEPEPEDAEFDEATVKLDNAISEALKSEDLEFANSLLAWLWLDGPAGPDGRVGDPARALLLEMNAIILGHSGDFADGESGFDAWTRLGEMAPPATIAWGDLDIPDLIELCETLVERIPGAESHVFEGTAHVPQMEKPAEVADAFLSALGRSAAS